jgi:flagella basal body P-ring formation protein FlgA
MIGFLLVMMGSSLAMSAPRITFFPRSEVAGDRVVLHDVARVEGVRDADQRASLYQLDLGDAPRPLSTRTLSRPRVLLLLKQAGMGHVRVVFPRKVVVVRPGQRMAGHAVSALCKRAVSEYVSSVAPTGVRAQVEGVAVRGALLLPAGEVSAVASSRSSGFGGSMFFTVSVLVNGVEAARKQVSGRVSLHGPTCRLAVDLARGHVLANTDLTETMGVIERGSIGCDAAIGKSLRTRGRAGTSVRASALEAPVIVHRRERVTLVYQSGPLRVISKGEAMKDGAAGEVIPVMNIDSRKVLRARVISPGRVTVQ